MCPILVLCLGNEVLSDDRFGYEIAERLGRDYLGPDVDVEFASAAGFNLVDLLRQRQHVLIVDTILTSQNEPGTLHFFPVGNLSLTNGLIHSHQINLPTALEFGRKMGDAMPEDIQVLAVEARDVTTLSERLTPPVAGVIDPTLDQIRGWVAAKESELQVVSS